MKNSAGESREAAPEVGLATLPVSRSQRVWGDPRFAQDGALPARRIIASA